MCFWLREFLRCMIYGTFAHLQIKSAAHIILIHSERSVYVWAGMNSRYFLSHQHHATRIAIITVVPGGYGGLVNLLQLSPGTERVTWTVTSERLHAGYERCELVTMHLQPQQVTAVHSDVERYLCRTSTANKCNIITTWDEHTACVDIWCLCCCICPTSAVNVNLFRTGLATGREAPCWKAHWTNGRMKVSVSAVEWYCVTVLSMKKML